jgi:hypothetical protein
MALSRIDTTNMIEDVPQSKLDNNINFRNILINSDMSIAQRGTSQASAGSTNGTYQTIDRFAFARLNLGAFTQSQSTDVPTGQGFANSMKFDCTTADASPAAGDYAFVLQYVEAQNCQYLKFGTSNATSLTLSFWVKSNKTGTYCFDIRSLDSARLISKSYTIDSADTWEKKTITYAGDTVGTINNDNGIGLQCSFWLGAGSNFTSGTLQTSWGSYVPANRAVGQVNLADNTANEWYITGVQLEAGQTASEFEFLPRGIMESLCHRYYQDYTDYNIYVMGKAYGASTSGLRQIYSLKTTMRASPTTVVSNTSNGGSSTNFTINTTSPKWVSFNLTSSNGSSVNMYHRFKFTADAEL